jgi:hypothetical protein
VRRGGAFVLIEAVYHVELRLISSLGMWYVQTWNVTSLCMWCVQTWNMFPYKVENCFGSRSGLMATSQAGSATNNY